MANRLILGRDMLAEMLIGEDYYPIFCAKDVSIELQQEEIEITNIDSSYSRQYKAGMSSGSMTISGITTIDNTEEIVSQLYLMQQSVRQLTWTWRITFTDYKFATTKQIQFQGIITNNSLSRNTSGFVNADLTIRITGNIDIGAVILPPQEGVLKSAYLPFVAGQTSVSYADLGDANILEVARDGVTFVETNGTPGNMQFKYVDNGTSGTIYFDTNNPSNGEVVYILYES